MRTPDKSPAAVALGDEGMSEDVAAASVLVDNQPLRTGRPPAGRRTRSPAAALHHSLPVPRTAGPSNSPATQPSRPCSSNAETTRTRVELEHRHLDRDK
jgi:hypothetical protein